MEKQIILPSAIYTIYDFFDKTRDIEWTSNPFVFYKNINDITIKIARDISNLNFYQIDIPIYGKINPKFIIKYLQNIDYRNYYAANTLYYKLITKIDDHKWIECEYRNQARNLFNIVINPYIILYYNTTNNFKQNISDTKYYNCYKILKKNYSTNESEIKYILRFESVFNIMDINQDIDIIIYINMINRMLKAIYKKFNI
jgi:hypothetical protein